MSVVYSHKQDRHIDTDFIEVLWLKDGDVVNPKLLTENEILELFNAELLNNDDIEYLTKEDLLRVASLGIEND